jgi:2-polyprenyl-3-methyl-5-hydroxy-6-metoxy-1,4-benzoquinol methylase
MLISPAYREQNQKLHESNPLYGTSSAAWAPKVRELLASFNGKSVLDYGCGKGKLAAALPDIDVREYDPCIPGKDAEPKPADIVACTDVLEHIEPECLDDVLKHIRSLTGMVAFLNISTKAAIKTLPDGRNAHLLIKDEEWWHVRLVPLFEMVEWKNHRDKEVNAVVKPRTK